MIKFKMAMLGYDFSKLPSYILTRIKFLKIDLRPSAKYKDSPSMKKRTYNTGQQRGGLAVQDISDN